YSSSGVQIMSAPKDKKMPGWSAEKGVPIFDYGKRSFRTSHVDPSGAGLFYLADEANKENFNVYRLDLETRKEKKLTNMAIVRQFTIDPREPRLIGLGKDQQKVEVGGGVADANATGPETMSLFELNWQSGEKKVLCTDAGRPFAFYEFDEPRIDGEGKRVAFVADLENKRTKHNLVVFDSDAGKLEGPLLPPIGRNTLAILGWDGDILYLLSDEGGATTSLYAYDY